MPDEIVPNETGTSFQSDAMANLQLEKLKAANDGQRYVSRICRISGRVVGAKGLPKMDSLSLSDPYAVVKAIKGNNHTINVHMTRCIQNTLAPVWDEEFDFAISRHAVSEEIVGLRVAVYDSDGPFTSFSGSNDFMGGAALDIAGQKHGRAISHELELGGILTRKASGRKPRLTIAITIYRDHVPRAPPRQLMLRQSLVHVNYIQQVFGVVVKATDLPNTELVGLSDPFCIVRAVLLSGQVVEVHRTKVVNDTLKPVWQEAFQSNFTELDQPLLLLFDLWDEDDPSKTPEEGGAQHLGSAVVPLLSALEPAPRRRRLWLQGATQKHETRLNTHGVPRNVGGRRAMRQTLKRSQSGIPSIGLIGRQYQRTFSWAEQGNPGGEKRWWSRMYDAAIQIKQQMTQLPEDKRRPILTVELRAYTETKRMPFHEFYEKPMFVHDEDDLEKCVAVSDWDRTLYTMPEQLRGIGGVERGSVTAEDHVAFVYGVIEGATSLPTFDQRPPEVYCAVHVISTTGMKLFIHRTRAIKQMICPQWNEAFYAEIPEGFDAARLQISVYAVVTGNGLSKFATSAKSGIFRAVSSATGSEELGEMAAPQDDDWFIGRAHADLTTAISGNLLAEEVPIQGGTQPKQEKVTSGYRNNPAVAFEVMMERRLRPRFDAHSGDGVQMIPRRYHLLTRSSDPIQQSLPYLDNSQVLMMQQDDLFRERAAQEVLELAATGTLAMRKGPKPDWSSVPMVEDDSPLHNSLMKQEDEELPPPVEEPEQKTGTLPFMTTREKLYREHQAEEERAAEVRHVDFTKRELRRKVRSLPVLKTKFGELPEDLFVTGGYREPAQALQARFSSRQEMKSADITRILHDKPVFSELQWQKPVDHAH